MIVGASARVALVEIEGRKLTLRNLGKVLWPEPGLTKADLINYYVEVSPYLLPHLRGRPFIMRPFPNGAGGRSYYRWELPDYAPAWLHHWVYEPRGEGRLIDMLVIDGLPELIWAANQACIELHPWLSRTDLPEYPDRALFDLDPGREAGFLACLEAAGWLHTTLQELGVRSYAKTSGRDGLHILVPLERRYLFREVRAWVQAVAREVVAAHPAVLTLDKDLQRRRGRVLIDYSQNGLGKSLVAPYSARATPQATVSAPLTWEEVAAAQVRPTDFTLLTVPQRLRRIGDLLAPLAEGQLLPQLPAR